MKKQTLDKKIEKIKKELYDLADSKFADGATMLDECGFMDLVVSSIRKVVEESLEEECGRCAYGERRSPDYYGKFIEGTMTTTEHKEYLGK